MTRSMEALMDSVIERCQNLPGRREMIYSPNYYRSTLLFIGPLPSGVRVNEVRRTWTFPNGSTLTFGYPYKPCVDTEGLNVVSIGF